MANTSQSFFTERLKTTSRKIAVLDYRDNSITEYDSGYDAARAYGIEHKDRVNTLARSNHVIPTHGCLFRFSENVDLYPWPKPTDDQLHALREQNYPPTLKTYVKLIDTRTNTVVFFGSYEDAAVFTDRSLLYVKNVVSRGMLLGDYLAIKVPREYKVYG